MENKINKQIMITVVYGFCVIAFLLSMFFIQKYTNMKSFQEEEEELNYVDKEIVENNYDYPVISTKIVITRPYLLNDITIGRGFYDYKGELSDQEKSILYYDNTYMQNSGVDYVYKDIFDVISILDGKVISVKKDELLGICVQIRHNNNLISYYQGLSEVMVKENDSVLQGQVLGKSGISNINKELGNHLHFELYYNGQIVNPEEFYNKNVNEL